MTCTSIIKLFISAVLCVLFSCSNNKAIGKNSIAEATVFTDYTEAEYVIDKTIDLKGKTMQIPECGRVVFTDKGRIINGTVLISPKTYEIVGGWGVFNNVKILPSTSLSNSVKCSLSRINARWFCSGANDSVDNTRSLQQAIDAAHNLFIPLYLPRGYYKITQSLVLKEGDVIIGDDSGIIDINNQRGATFIRYSGNGPSMINVTGKYVTLQNILLSASTPFQSDGITLDGDAGLYFNLENVLIGNAKYGVTGTLSKNKGLSECIWDKVKIWNCVRGISIDINSESGQYMTYNTFRNVFISNMKEKGIFLHCRAINSCSFRDCLIETVGYAGACDDKYIGSGIYAMDIVNEGVQGSIIVDGGYFENTYFSKTNGEIVKSFNYSNNAVFSLKNISLSLMNTRFANTRTIVKSNGQDIINIINCIDNGYLGPEVTDISVCKTNPKTVIEVNGYTFANKNKEIVGPISKSLSPNNNISIKNIRKKEGALVN